MYCRSGQPEDCQLGPSHWCSNCTESPASTLHDDCEQRRRGRVGCRQQGVGERGRDGLRRYEQRVRQHDPERYHRPHEGGAHGHHRCGRSRLATHNGRGRRHRHSQGRVCPGYGRHGRYGWHGRNGRYGRHDVKTPIAPSTTEKIVSHPT
uniref:Uncharacterized protein n=1 Tax=Cacopsylla melanoneura TaxID=428564 RepID=A0A8D8R2Q5_9HEMI